MSNVSQERLSETDLREIEGIVKVKDDLNLQNAYNVLPLLIKEIKRLQAIEAERDMLKGLCDKSFAFVDAMVNYANENLQVVGWHMNGDAEPLENFVNDNMDADLWQELKNIKGADTHER